LIVRRKSCILILIIFGKGGRTMFLNMLDDATVLLYADADNYCIVACSDGSDIEKVMYLAICNRGYKEKINDK
jgi:hypothetical protein